MEWRALQVGDVVILLEPKKLGPGSYRLAMVSELHPDERGIVRTVTVSLPKQEEAQRGTARHEDGCPKAGCSPPPGGALGWPGQLGDFVSACLTVSKSADHMNMGWVVLSF